MRHKFNLNFLKINKQKLKLNEVTNAKLKLKVKRRHVPSIFHLGWFCKSTLIKIILAWAKIWIKK